MITTVTRIIETEPTVRLEVEGEAGVRKVTRVIEGKPPTTKLTRVIHGDPTNTKVTRVIEGSSYLEMSFTQTL